MSVSVSPRWKPRFTLLSWTVEDPLVFPFKLDGTSPLIVPKENRDYLNVDILEKVWVMVAKVNLDKLCFSSSVTEILCGK